MKKPETIPEQIGAFVGLLAGVFLISCLRGWLLSLCAALFFPTFVLGFWQWVLLAFTIRVAFLPSTSSND